MYEKLKYGDRFLQDTSYHSIIITIIVGPSNKLKRCLSP